MSKRPRRNRSRARIFMHGATPAPETLGTSQKFGPLGGSIPNCSTRLDTTQLILKFGQTTAKHITLMQTTYSI